MIRLSDRNKSMLEKLANVAARFDADTSIRNAIQAANAEVDDDWNGTKTVEWSEDTNFYAVVWRINQGSIVDVVSRVTVKDGSSCVTTEQRFFPSVIDNGKNRL